MTKWFKSSWTKVREILTELAAKILNFGLRMSIFDKQYRIVLGVISVTLQYQ